MKQLIVLCLLVSGCGLSNKIGQTCGGAFERACLDLFGGEDDRDQNSNLAQLNARVQSLYSQLDFLVSLIPGLVTGPELTSVQNQISVLELDLQATIAQVAVLQGYSHVTQIIDPCGDAPGKVDEVLLRLSTGETLVSFSDNSSGLNTRFSVLSPGTYGTTDGTGCVFVLHGSGAVTW
jgi:hypothetical protein